MTDLFDEINLETNEDDLIGALKTKFSSEGNIDTDKLLRAKFEADRHIARLEAEAAERQKELAKQSTMEEILERIKATSTPPVQPQANQPSGEPSDKQSPNVEEVVSTLLAQKEQAAKLEANRRRVAEGLTKVFGGSAQIELNKKAKELGLSLSDLKEQGDKNPDLLFRILGVNPDQKVEAPRGAVAPRPSPSNQGTSHEGVRDKAYYNRMKASNPEEYRSQRVQMQMYKDWMKNPELFA